MRKPVSLSISMWSICICAARFLKIDDGLMGWDDAGSHQRVASLLTRMYGNEDEGLRQPLSREGYDDLVSSSKSHFVDVSEILVILFVWLFEDWFPFP